MAYILIRAQTFASEIVCLGLLGWGFELDLTKSQDACLFLL